MKFDTSAQGTATFHSNMRMMISYPVDNYLDLIREYQKDLELWMQSSRKAPMPTTPSINNNTATDIPAGTVVEFKREDSYFDIVIKESSVSSLIGATGRFDADTTTFIWSTAKGAIFDSSSSVIFADGQTFKTKSDRDLANDTREEIGDHQFIVDLIVKEFEDNRKKLISAFDKEISSFVSKINNNYYGCSYWEDVIENFLDDHMSDRTIINDHIDDMVKNVRKKITEKSETGTISSQEINELDFTVSLYDLEYVSYDFDDDSTTTITDDISSCEIAFEQMKESINSY